MKLVLNQERKLGIRIKLPEPRAGRCARIGSLNMENNFKNHEDFEKYLEEQDKWIYEWSLPEHYLFAYMLEKSIKYKAGKVVEYIYMVRSGNIFTNDISVYHKKDEQPHEIWSGNIDSPDEYQEMMSVVNKFIEENKQI